MRKLVPLIAIGLLAAGCAVAGPTASPGGSPTANPTAAGRYDVPSGANDLVMRIATSGGLVPPGYILTEMPDWTLFGDGRIIVRGPVAEIYPLPLLPNLRVMRVTPPEIQKILAAADGAGLLGPDARYDAVGIMDAGTTVFTTVVAGKVHRISAYALMPDAQTENQATAEARAKLIAFEGKTSDLSSFLGRKVDDIEAYQPTAIRAFVSQANPVSSVPTAGGTVLALRWPLATDPFKSGEATTNPGTVCVVLSGGDLSTFLSVAKDASALSIWTYGASRYSVRVRPLYPNESGCTGSTP